MRYQLISGLVFLLAFCHACHGGEVDKQARDVSMAVIDGTARGFAFPAVTLLQHQRALANWKLQFAKETPTHAESSHFLLYGSLPGKNLKDLGAALEKQYALALKVLASEHEEPWPGKMAIYFYENKLFYAGFCRTVEKRRVDEDESGTVDGDSDFPHAAATAPLLKGELPADLQAGAQMASAILQKKAGSKAPHWFLHAFGRANALKASSPTVLASDHRKAHTYLAKNKRNLKDLFGKDLPDEEGLVLRGSFLEYLAHSGKITRLPQILKGFAPTDETPEPTVEMALEKADYPLDKLDSAWQAWVKATK